MKTFKLKLVIGAASLFGGLMLSSVPMYAADPVNPNTEESYQKDNALIRDDLAAVRLHQDHVKDLCDKLKKDRTANLDEAVIIDKRDLAKARADLKRSKAYLAADKKDLRNDYRLAIRNRNDDARKAQANLDKYRDKLDKDIANGTEDAIAYDANKIAYYQNEVRRHKNLAKLEADHLETNFAAIDKEYNSTIRVQTPAPAKTETAYYRNTNKNK